jgi:transcriptional regulator with XRE-family HTH domain
MSNVIEETIKTKFGTINSFVDKNYSKLPMSRTHIYKLLNFEIQNPGIQTLEALAKLLELPTEEVINDYLAGYRDKWNKNQY